MLDLRSPGVVWTIASDNSWLHLQLVSLLYTRVDLPHWPGRDLRSGFALEIPASHDGNYFWVEVCGAASFCFAELYVHIAMSGRSDPRWRCMRLDQRIGDVGY